MPEKVRVAVMWKEKLKIIEHFFQVVVIMTGCMESLFLALKQQMIQNFFHFRGKLWQKCRRSRALFVDMARKFHNSFFFPFPRCEKTEIVRKPNTNTKRP